MSSSGHRGFTWLHCVISPSAAGSHMVLSCSLVTPVAKSFCLLTTTEMPSKATGISINSTPFSSHTGTSSATSIGLEASEIWVSPLQNASKPSLVPEPPMLILASGFCSLNNSAAACVIGCTVLEPSTAISPETGSPPPWPPPPPPPQAATPRDPARPNAAHPPGRPRAPPAAPAPGGNDEPRAQRQGRPRDEPHTRDPTQPTSSWSQTTKDFGPTSRA